MRWYDYPVCVWFAWQIAGGLLYLNLVSIIFGMIGYKIYEDYRVGKY